jgi:23S rRNA (cytidine1920-2'-O)/16S rRNA (cytidine1409-2'-O)-methyltransferase
MKKMRADRLLVDRGLVESREKAQTLIAAGAMRAGGQRVVRPASLLDPAVDVSLEAGPRYVSRGGEKLEHALRVFSVDPRGLVCLDIGSSTGGFTDCLLQRGAVTVYAVDAGRGQLHLKLRNDPRVVAMEETNARDLSALPERPRLVVADVSFISLEKVLPAAFELVVPGADLVVLLKPQFEAGPADVGADGVVRDPAVHARVIGRFVHWATTNGFGVYGLTTSPLRGPAGNKEFLLHLRHEIRK